MHFSHVPPAIAIVFFLLFRANLPRENYSRIQSIDAICVRHIFNFPFEIRQKMVNALFPQENPMKCSDLLDYLLLNGMRQQINKK